MAAKNIAVFCDGTWQHLDQAVPTNVNRLVRATLPRDAAGTPQVVRYDDGVGVGTGVLADAVHLVGGAFGEGLEDKVMQAYTFLGLNYEPGDAIFIFGFSRGAFTARSLAGLLHLVWLLRRENADRLEEARAIYHDPARRETGPARASFDARVAAFRARYCHPAETAAIRYVGVWDTVGELGIPTTLPLATQVNDRFRFFDTSLSSFTRSARHAVALDERRDAYTPTLWDNIDALNEGAGAAGLPYAERPYQQQWFPGRHSGVGGGQDDGGLCLAALAWIAEGAAARGLALDAAQMATYAAGANVAAPFIVEPSSLGNQFVSRIGGVSDRHGPSSPDEVAAASFERWRRVADWRPASLSQVAAAMNAGLNTAGRANVAAAPHPPVAAREPAGDAGAPPFG